MNEQRRLEQLALASLTEETCPDAEQLAGYILGTLTGQDQLKVAAHVRTCPLCQQDMADCRPPEPHRSTIRARLAPLVLAGGRRGSNDLPHVRQYLAADMTIDLTIAPPDGDHWRVTGQILRGGAPIAERQITMRAGRRRHQQISDAHGFFTFERLPTGRYTLTVTDKQIQIQIQALLLGLNDDE